MAEPGEIYIFQNLRWLYWKPPDQYLANSEDPDEMSQYAAFQQGLHCLLR